MRRVILASTILTLSAGVAAQAAETTVSIQLDRAHVIRVPDGTQTLIIGNPMIADVTLLRSANSMVITGRSFGTTNLIALDASGNPLAESDVKVGANPHRILVMRGLNQQSYSCNPQCAPTIALDDDKKHMDETIGAAVARNGAAASGAR